MNPNSLKLPLIHSIWGVHRPAYLRFLGRSYSYNEQQMHNFWFNHNYRCQHFLSLGFTQYESEMAANSFGMYGFPLTAGEYLSLALFEDYQKYFTYMSVNSAIFSVKVPQCYWLAMVDSYIYVGKVPPCPVFTVEYFKSICFYSLDRTCAPGLDMLQ